MLILLIILFYPRFPQGWKLLVQFIPLVLLALAVAVSRRRWGDVRGVRFLCNFSPVFFVIVIYELLGGIIPYLRPEVDDLLMKIDVALFGVHPTIRLERFFVPWLTDILAVAYASYYFIPVVLITIIYFWGKEEEFFHNHLHPYAGILHLLCWVYHHAHYRPAVYLRILV